jgi:hypothetical protein
VLDNHAVELGTQGKNFILQVARREEGRIQLCGENTLDTTLYT